MSKRLRGNHAPAFKTKVALESAKGEHALSELVERFDVHLNPRLPNGKRSCWSESRRSLSGAYRHPRPVDMKTLRAKISDLTLENYFLEGALTKTGLLSAKR